MAEGIDAANMFCTKHETQHRKDMLERRERQREKRKGKGKGKRREGKEE